MTDEADEPSGVQPTVLKEQSENWPDDSAYGVDAFVSLLAVGTSAFLVAVALIFMSPISGSFRAVATTLLVLTGALVLVAYRFRNQRGRVVLLRLFHNAMVAVWSGVLLALIFMPLGGGGSILVFLYLVMFAGVILLSLPYAGVRQAVTSLLALAIVVAASWVQLESDSWLVTWPVIAEAQLRLAEPHLRSDISGGRTEIVSEWHAWQWYRRVPDGASGVLYDPEHQVADEVRASDIWGSLTTDSSRCAHLYDGWYWCP